MLAMYRSFTLLLKGPEIVQSIHSESDVYDDIRGVFRSDVIVIDNKLIANTPGYTFVFWTVVSVSTWWCAQHYHSGI